MRKIAIITAMMFVCIGPAIARTSPIDTGCTGITRAKNAHYARCEKVLHALARKSAPASFHTLITDGGVESVEDFLTEAAAAEKGLK
jgi:hypothetical protein